MIMGNIYEMIWADALHKTKSKNRNIRNNDLIWDNLLFLSVITALNFATIIGWISYYFMGYVYTFELKLIMPNTLVDKIFSVGIQLYIPSLVLNYFSIFFNNKHLKIMEKYSSREGKIVLTYIFISIGIFIISAIIIGIFIRSGIVL